MDWKGGSVGKVLAEWVWVQIPNIHQSKKLGAKLCIAVPARGAGKKRLDTGEGPDSLAIGSAHWVPLETLFQNNVEPGVVLHTINPGISEAEARESLGIWG